MTAPAERIIRGTGGESLDQSTRVEFDQQKKMVIDDGGPTSLMNRASTKPSVQAYESLPASAEGIIGGTEEESSEQNASI